MDDDFLDYNPASATPSTRPALLVAALLHLMSQYTLRSAGRGARDDADTEGPCVKLAAVIERHLDALARLPDAEPVLRATCEQLRVKWEDLVDSRLPVPVKRPLLSRLLRPAVFKPQALAS
jgi:hypothetical protein